MPAASKIIVIGSGFAGLSVACVLASKGYRVQILEKNHVPGGRARVLEAQGFRFDMGPSWYWMPDVFEDFFALFGKKVSDYYELVRLDPAYTIVYGPGDQLVVPADRMALEALFESYEKGAALKLRSFLKQAAYKYEVGIRDLVFKPGRSVTEFLSPKLLWDVLRMDVFNSIASHVRSHFKHPHLVKMMEFPVLFLGATPKDTPALYSLMNYADLGLGTWYPMGGMGKIVDAMVSLAQELGVEILYGKEALAVGCNGNQVKTIETNNGVFETDVVVVGSDYRHFDQEILPTQHRNYSHRYWENRTLAPSSLLFYIGLSQPVPGLTHHTLFFDEDFGLHAEEIYTRPQWPTKPLFYTSLASKTDPSVAPEGMENLVILVPLAPGLQDTEEIRERYYSMIMDRFERLTGHSLREWVVYKKSYAHNDFIKDYHSFKGNAYGLANTLRQTAILKPSLKHRSLSNLYFCGQLTVPGPGVPPSLISGRVVAEELAKEWPNQ
ncbi:MAG: phytoene desaturase [Sphingomonadales bacterium]|nr:phytoene desaturase [Sphingomonadales bacterium]